MTSRVFVSGLFTAGIAAGLLGGCVYYNGMYNANRLPRSARKAEREGRTFEANNLWGQVATKAESVAVRHPTKEHYLDSPYLAMVRGDATEAYRQLEDSLGAFAASLSGPLPQGVRRPPPGRDDDDRPKRRPGPPPGASRVPEP